MKLRCNCFVLCLLILIPSLAGGSTVLQSGDIVFLTDGGSDDPDRVWHLDPSTGSLTVLSEGGLLMGIPTYVKAISSTEVVVGNLFEGLVSVDTVTGVQTQITATGPEDPSLQFVFGVDSNQNDFYFTGGGFGSGHSVYRFYTTTDQREIVANGASDLRDIGIDSTGQIYVVDNDLNGTDNGGILQVNNGSFISFAPGSSLFGYSSLAIDGADKVFGNFYDLASEAFFWGISSYDPIVGIEEEYRGPANGSSIIDLDVNPDGELVLSMTNGIFVLRDDNLVNLNSGAGFYAGLDVFGPPGIVGFTPPFPEPNSAILLALACGLASFSRQRK